MPGMDAAVEAEMLWNGGDERAASALVRENNDMGMEEITARLHEADHSAGNQDKAA